MVQLLYVIASLHTLLCPFTKVEESFNIQATHDILYHRLNLSQYDHNEFPGVVPRSFIGPLALSVVSAPTVSIFYLMDLNKFWSQYVARLALALTVIAAWTQLKNTLKKLYGNSYAWWYTVITCTQYHFMFYMSRPLPNIMALPLVLLAFEGWLSNKHKQFLISAGASIIIFRSELAMLFGLFLIMDLYFKKIEIVRLLQIVVPAGLGLVALTVAVDSFFWGRLIWPEAEVFWYNTILNKSSDWGTSPFLWYFYSALPRGLGPSLLLIPIGLYLDKRMVQIVAPAFVYILLYSFLPHKELRFIIYVFPLLNMASAAACSFIYIRRTKAPIYELLFWGQIFIIVGNIAIAVALACVAMTNYPGGVAMSRFHRLLAHEPSTTYIHVHVSNLAAQTGVTRFMELNSHWKYSKNESLEPEQLQEYTHLLIEAKSKYSPSVKTFTQTHDVLDSIESFSHIALSYKFMPPVKIKTRPAIFILERKDFREYPFGHNFENIDVNEITQVNELLIEGSVSGGSVEQIKDYVVEDFEGPVTEEFAEPVVEELKEPVMEEFEEMYENNDLDDSSEEILPTPEIEETLNFDENIVEKDDFVKEDTTTKQEEDIMNDEIVDEPLPAPLPKPAKSKMVRNRNLEPPEGEETLPTSPKLAKAKKALDDLKTLRQERKKKAIQKIKSETRKEVVASAKQKLKEIMKRHKHIADEFTENVTLEGKNEISEDIDGRGDIPEQETVVEKETMGEMEPEEEQPLDSLIQINETFNSSNENVDSIVEEVIVRLIDRKIYDDKTKPEDIKAEDRQMIQKIVEEVLSERMNYTKS